MPGYGYGRMGAVRRAMGRPRGEGPPPMMPKPAMPMAQPKPAMPQAPAMPKPPEMRQDPSLGPGMEHMDMQAKPAQAPDAARQAQAFGQAVSEQAKQQGAVGPNMEAIKAQLQGFTPAPMNQGVPMDLQAIFQQRQQNALDEKMRARNEALAARETALRRPML